MNNFTHRAQRGFTYLLLAVTPLFLTGCGLRNDPATNNQAKQTLTYWHIKQGGDEKVFEQMIAGFEKDFPTVDIEVTLFEPTEEYETKVINALAAGKGPDIWEIRDDELARHKDKLVGFPFQQKGEIEIFKKTYATAVAQQMIVDSTLYGMPIAIDPLVLFINTDHMRQAGIDKPPKSWEELAAYAKQTTLRTEEGIVRPGFALGTSTNVDRASQILQLIMLQLGVPMVDPAHKQATFDLFVQDKKTGEYRYLGQEALAFYASFADPTSAYQSWDGNQPYSTQAFATGNLSMMINYLSLVPQMKLLNPELKYTVASVPQRDIKTVPVGDTPAEVTATIQLAKYRSLVVSKSTSRLTKEQKTRRETLAWQFIQYLTANREVTEKYAEQTSLIPPQISSDTNNTLGQDDKAINAIVNPKTQNWYKGPSPRIVDQILGETIRRIAEEEQPLPATLTEAAQAVTGILR